MLTLALLLYVSFLGSQSRAVSLYRIKPQFSIAPALKSGTATESDGESYHDNPLL